jgi:hypothetical protein
MAASRYAPVATQLPTEGQETATSSSATAPVTTGASVACQLPPERVSISPKPGEPTPYEPTATQLPAAGQEVDIRVAAEPGGALAGSAAPAPAMLGPDAPAGAAATRSPTATVAMVTTNAEAMAASARPARASMVW